MCSNNKNEWGYRIAQDRAELVSMFAMVSEMQESVKSIGLEFILLQFL